MKKLIVICLLLLSMPVYAAEVAFWSFNGSDGISNDTAVDVSANSNDGTIYGAIVTAGKIGQALSFDGINDYVNCGNDASLNITGAITVEAWVKLNTALGWSPIVSKNTGTTRGIFLCIINDIVYVTYAEVGRYKAAPILSADTFYHLAFTSDGTSLVVYVDGVSQGLIALKSHYPSQSDLHIGHMTYAGSTNKYFNGLIDEVRIYNTALTPAQILINFQRGRSVRMNPASSGKILMTPSAAGKLKFGEE